MQPNHKFVLQKARGELFAWVEDDDEIPKDYIERLVDRFGDSPHIVLVYTRCDRFLDGKFWYSYDTHSNVGESTFARLRRLLHKGYWRPYAFEQYWYGVFRREALLASVWKTDKFLFRTLFTMFFRLSEKGFIDVVDDVVMRKNTTAANLEKYKKGDYVHRPWMFRWLGRDMEETLPVTIAMLSTIAASRNLKVLEKSFLMLLCAKFFVRATAGVIRKQSRRRTAGLRHRLDSKL